MFPEAWHCPHVTAQRIDKPGPGAQAQFADGQREARRCAFQFWIMAEAQVRLCHADRQAAEAAAFVISNLALGLRRVRNASRAVNIRGNRFDLGFDWLIESVQKMK